MMSLLLVVAVGVLVFGYVRLNRRARLAWLTKIDLPGRWHWEQGQDTLTLNGQVDRGRFIRVEEGRQVEGDWRLQGHILELQVNGDVTRFDLQFFQSGKIGLQDESGKRRLYLKERSNVVSMADHR